ANVFERWNLNLAKHILDQHKAGGNQIFTGAFNISNSGSTKPKIDRVCDDYIQPVWEQRKHLVHCLTSDEFNTGHKCTLAEAFSIINKLPGLGGSGFMAAQVIC